MAGEIISEHRARSNRNGGRDHLGFAGDFPRNPQLGRCGYRREAMGGVIPGARSARDRCSFLAAIPRASIPPDHVKLTSIRVDPEYVTVL